MNDMTQQTSSICDKNSFGNSFKPSMENLCRNLLRDCNVNGWELNDVEIAMLQQAIVKANATDHDEVSEVIANQFRIDAHTLRLIDKGYWLHVDNSLWVANASDVLTILSREGIEALDVQDAIDSGIAEWQDPLPKNPRYTIYDIESK